MSVQQIQAKIESLEQRRAELKADAESAANELAEAREDLIAGKDGADARATEEQARLTSTNGTIEPVESRLEGLRDDLQEARKNIDHAERIERLAELAQAAAEAMKTYDATQQELSKQFEAAADVMQDAWRTVEESHRVFRKLRNGLEKELSHAEILRRLEGADLSIVMSEQWKPEPIKGKYAQILGTAIVNASRITAREEITGRSVAETQATA